MLSISFLFEENITANLPKAKAPTAERDNYIKQRVESLRKMIGKKGVDVKEINNQIQSYLKKRYSPEMGVTQY